MKWTWRIALVAGLAMFLIGIPTKGDTLRNKDLKRRFPTGWCPLEYPFSTPFYHEITPRRSYVDITFSGDVYDPVFEIWAEQKLDALRVVRKDVYLALDGASQPKYLKPSGCYQGADVTYFDVVAAENDGHQIEWSDDFIDGIGPEWTLAPAGSVHWDGNDTSPIPQLFTVPESTNGSMALGTNEDAPGTVATARIRIRDLVPGVTYVLTGFWSSTLDEVNLRLRISDTDGDFDADGWSDLLWRNDVTGENAIWLMDGAAVTAGWILPTVNIAGLKIVATGDFNGDGHGDVVWRNELDGTNAVWLLADGTVQQGAYLPTISDTGLKIVGAGDFNGDGNDDLLWRKPSDGTTALWFMNGVTVLSGAWLSSIPAPMEVAGVGDLNGDGWSDVVWRNPSTGENAVWLMNGATVSTGAYLPTVSNSVMVMAAIGDFNGDGNDDIFWRNASTGANAIWFMSGYALLGGSYPPDAAPGFQLVATGDLDADGYDDVVFRDTGSGLNAVWFLHETGYRNGATLPVIPDSHLKIVGPR